MFYVLPTGSKVGQEILCSVTNNEASILYCLFGYHYIFVYYFRRKVGDIYLI